LFQHVLPLVLVAFGEGQRQVTVAPLANAVKQPPVKVQAGCRGDDDDEIVHGEPLLSPR
jgi:hypothetical protein